MIEAKEEAWDAAIEADPGIAKWRGTQILFKDMLDSIFKGRVAEGKYSQHSEIPIDPAILGDNSTAPDPDIVLPVAPLLGKRERELTASPGKQGMAAFARLAVTLEERLRHDAARPVKQLISDRRRALRAILDSVLVKSGRISQGKRRL